MWVLVLCGELHADYGVPYMLISTLGWGTTGDYEVPYLLISTLGGRGIMGPPYMLIVIRGGVLRGTTGSLTC